MLNFADKYFSDLLQWTKRKENLAWKELKPPFTLRSCLASMTKEELVNLRKFYGFTGISNLLKDELIEKLTELVPKNFSSMLRHAGQLPYISTNLISLSNGIFEGSLFHFRILINLRRYCFVFFGIHEGQKVLLLPDELLQIFRSEAAKDLKEQMLINEKILAISGGMIHYYGLIPEKILYDRVIKLTGFKTTLEEFMKIMEIGSDFNGAFYISEYGFTNLHVHDVNRLYDSIRANPGIKYFDFAPDHLINKSILLNNNEYVPESEKVIDLLKSNYEYEENEAEDLVSDKIRELMMGEDIDNIEKDILYDLKDPSGIFKSKLKSALKDMSDNTRRWSLKGHTPNELKPENEQPEREFKIVGRNSPCPCGSGKKYKKCCGR